jgi:hypothetical protein
MHDTVAQRGNVSYDPLGDEEKEDFDDIAKIGKKLLLKTFTDVKGIVN